MVTIYKDRFTRMHSCMDILENKIHVKSGFWVFKSHIYTIEELLKSEEHEKIYSLAEKTGDDIKNVDENGKLSFLERNYYHTQRNRVEDRLREINQKISIRQPTWWESMKEPLIKFIHVVMELMPERYQTLLQNVGVKLIEWTGKGAKKGYKLLSDKMKG